MTQQTPTSELVSPLESQRARIARGEEAAERGAGQPRVARLVAQVPPQEHRDRHEHHGVQHVIAEAIAEQRHRQEADRAEVLGDVGRRRVAAEQAPVPADDDAPLQQGHAVRGLLEQLGPVVLEGDLAPHGGRHPAAPGRQEQRRPGGQEHGQPAGAQRHGLADPSPVPERAGRGGRQRGRVPRQAPALQRARQVRPARRAQEIDPRERQRDGESQWGRPGGKRPGRSGGTSHRSGYEPRRLSQLVSHGRCAASARQPVARASSGIPAARAWRGQAVPCRRSGRRCCCPVGWYR